MHKRTQQALPQSKRLISIADVCTLMESIIADIKGRPLKAYKRGTIHGMVCLSFMYLRLKSVLLTDQMIPLGPNAGAGYVTFPLLGDTMFPEFMVKKAKAEGLFVDQFLGRFKGAKVTA